MLFLRELCPRILTSQIHGGLVRVEEKSRALGFGVVKGTGIYKENIKILEADFNFGG